jgi:hypothetical protein
LFVPRRISIALLLLALFWVGEPAYALWKVAADHACCLPKPAAAEPSCHGVSHHDAGPTFAAGHSHSDCAHDCCTKQRTANGSAVATRAIAIGTAESAQSVIHATTEITSNAQWSSLSERGPPAIA